MAKVVSAGYTDTAVGGCASLTTTVKVINWGADYRLLSINPNEVVVRNVTAPKDQPESFRFTMREVANIYNLPNSGVNVDLDAQSRVKTGKQLLVEHRYVIKITDDTDVNYIRYIPRRTGLSVLISDDSNISDNTLLGEIQRLLAGIFEQGGGTVAGTTDSTGVAALARGVLTKKAMIS